MVEANSGFAGADGRRHCRLWTGGRAGKGLVDWGVRASVGVVGLSVEVLWSRGIEERASCAIVVIKWHLVGGICSGMHEGYSSARSDERLCCAGHPLVRDERCLAHMFV